uniref:Uncharacterized protein n=1 Tax=Musa acuminata subsp. malaccensis TaxID=214687 RepID=A0A804IXC3_MUSAM
MASHMLKGAELLPLSKVRNPTGLGFMGSSLNGICLPN